MAHRYKIDEFAALIRREGGLVDLFMKTGLEPTQVPGLIRQDVMEINRLRSLMEARFAQVAKVCGYDEDEEG